MFWKKKNTEQQTDNQPQQAEPKEPTVSQTAPPPTNSSSPSLIVDLTKIQSDNRVKEMIIINLSEKVESMVELKQKMNEEKEAKHKSFFKFMSPYIYTPSEIISARRLVLLCVNVFGVPEK